MTLEQFKSKLRSLLDMTQSDIETAKRLGCHMMVPMMEATARVVWMIVKWADEVDE